MTKNKQKQAKQAIGCFHLLENKQLVVCVSYDVDNKPNKNKQLVVSLNRKNKQMLVCP